MDPIYAAKLLKYSPAELQSVTYVVEYASHNCEDVKEIHEYIESKLKTDRLIEIADIILENKNMATIKAKPSAASGKIDSVKEKQTTEGPVTATQRSISTKASDASPKTEEVIKEEEADRLRDRRMERGGLGGNQRYGSSASSNKGAKKYDPAATRAAQKKAVDMVRAQITAQYGKGALKNSFEPETTGENLEEKKGLWDNIHAKRERGEHPAKPGDKNYPKTLNVEENEVEEGYKPIDKKKENAMYRRAGNLARTSLSSKGKNKEDAQNKSSKIVSAIARQKENERFAKMGDEKARSNYKEDVEFAGNYEGPLYAPHPDLAEGLKNARKNVGAGKCWDGYVAKGTKMKGGKEVPNCVKESEEWMWDLVDELNEEFDTLTDLDLQDLIIEALVDLDSEELLQEACETFAEMELLTEDYYDSAVKASKAAAKTPAARAGRRALRVQKVKKAAAAVGSALKSGASKAGEAAKSAASKAGEGAKKVGSGAKAAVKSGAKKVIGAASSAAGHAVGSYQAARIKAKREALSKSKSSGGDSKPAAKSSGSDKDAETRKKGEALLDKIRSSGGKSSSSSSSSSTTSSGSSYSGGSSSGGGSSSSSSGGSSSSDSGTKKKSLLRRAGSAIKRGIKKVVGKTARAVSRGSDKVARRLGEEKTPEQQAKSAALAKSKELTKQGKHKEASEVFNKAFPNFGK